MLHLWLEKNKQQHVFKNKTSFWFPVIITKHARRSKAVMIKKRKRKYVELDVRQLQRGYIASISPTTGSFKIR